MAGTRAKFYVSGLTLLPGQGAGVTLNLSAVSRGDRNASWATATPSGSIAMTIQNPSAVKWWEDFMNAARATGKQPELFVDIYPSEDGWAGDGHVFKPSSGTPGTIYDPKYCAECGHAQDADQIEYERGEDGYPVYPSKSKVVGKVHPNG